MGYACRRFLKTTRGIAVADLIVVNMVAEAAMVATSEAGAVRKAQRRAKRYCS